MNLGEINDILRYIANKTQGGNLPPNRFQDIMNMASRELLNSYLPSRIKNYAKTVYEEDAKISSDLYPFKTITDMAIGADGHAAYPSDYVYLSSCRKVLTTVNDPDPLKAKRK